MITMQTSARIARASAHLVKWSVNIRIEHEHTRSTL